jgi:hypothetical protein
MMAKTVVIASQPGLETFQKVPLDSSCSEIAYLATVWVASYRLELGHYQMAAVAGCYFLIGALQSLLGTDEIEIDLASEFDLDDKIVVVVAAVETAVEASALVLGYFDY